LDDPGVVGPEQGERPIARGEWARKEDLSRLVQTLEMGEVSVRRSSSSAGARCAVMESIRQQRDRVTPVNGAASYLYKP
jgi:hypothetical protein